MGFSPILLQSKPQRTEKLFHQSVSLLDAKARVVEVQDNFVVLDRTIFYAESGGQEYDTGLINEFPVVDVQDQGGRLLPAHKTRVPIPSIKIDTVVVHKLAERANFEVGQEVELRVDRDRRRNLMRSHGAAHFLLQAARLLLGKPDDPLYLKGCHITEDACRFDFFGTFDSNQAQDVAVLTNELIDRGGPIQMVRSEVSDEVFYWIWEDVIIPCGGTHVDDASAVPHIRISRSKKGQQLTRFKATWL
ncbi:MULTISPECIES: alanyl-tRNA editing protein [unclassified Bradyrhizobium]|uniref:alanyl-tRNA editing protein n=1 Tax=unclassified Bradyrhizobium TaxID=2631580 RepID=UPI002915D7B2|nr:MULTISPECIES: alanyl-tRNA editing protein [unclassified Bradyrhizobium]